MQPLRPPWIAIAFALAQDWRPCSCSGLQVTPRGRGGAPRLAPLRRNFFGIPVLFSAVAAALAGVLVALWDPGGPPQPPPVAPKAELFLEEELRCTQNDFGSLSMPVSYNTRSAAFGGALQALTRQRCGTVREAGRRRVTRA